MLTRREILLLGVSLVLSCSDNNKIPLEDRVRRDASSSDFENDSSLDVTGDYSLDIKREDSYVPDQDNDSSLEVGQDFGLDSQEDYLSDQRILEDQRDTSLDVGADYVPDQDNDLAKEDVDKCLINELPILISTDVSQTYVPRGGTVQLSPREYSDGDGQVTGWVGYFEGVYQKNGPLDIPYILQNMGGFPGNRKVSLSVVDNCGIESNIIDHDVEFE